MLLASAYAAALAWVVRDARRAGFDPEVFMSLGFTAIVGALIGAAVGSGGVIAATEGKDVKLEPGTIIRMRLDQAVDVKGQK